MSGYISSGGHNSSRVFTDNILKVAISKLPSTQARTIRRLARVLNTKTGIGYYASLDVVAGIGLRLLETPSSLVSAKLSTNSTVA